MILRNIPLSLDPTTVAAIDARLESIARTHEVSIPWAIESGSRAWGFPSPDSDYDCRFVFVRPHDRYLSLFPDRDVIETPLVNDLDVNGWDLQKAIRLMLKGNAVIIEWLTSPIIYQGNDVFRRAMLNLAEQVLQRERVARHYYHLALSMRSRAFPEHGEALLKKLFYVLRPAVALRWMTIHHEARIAPMHFPTLIEQAGIPENLKHFIDELIERKSLTRELGSAEVPMEVRHFIDHQLDNAESIMLTETAVSPDAIAIADAAFRNIMRIAQ